MDSNGDPYGYYGHFPPHPFGPSQAVSVQRHSMGQSMSVLYMQNRRQGDAPSGYHRSAPQQMLTSLNTNVPFQSGSVFTAINVTPRTPHAQTSVLLTPNASPSTLDPSSAHSQKTYHHSFPNQQPLPQGSPQDPTPSTRYQWPQHIPNGRVIPENDHISEKSVSKEASEEQSEPRYFCVDPLTIGTESECKPNVPIGKCSNKSCLKKDGFSSPGTATRHLRFFHFNNKDSKPPPDLSLLGFIEVRMTVISNAKKRATAKRKRAAENKALAKAKGFLAETHLNTGNDQTNSLSENRLPENALPLQPNLGIQPNHQLHSRRRVSVPRPPPLDTEGELPPLRRSDTVRFDASLPSIQTIRVPTRLPEPETLQTVNPAALHQWNNGSAGSVYDHGWGGLALQSDHSAGQAPLDAQRNVTSAHPDSQPPQAISIEPIFPMNLAAESSPSPMSIPSPLLRSPRDSETRDNGLGHALSESTISNGVIESTRAATDLVLDWGRLRTMNESHEVIDPRSAVSQPRPPFIRLGWLLLVLENDFVSHVYSAILAVGKIEAAAELGRQIRLMAVSLRRDGTAKTPRHEEFCHLIETWCRYELANAVIEAVLYKKHGEVLASTLAPNTVVLDVPMEPLANYIKFSIGFASLKRFFEDKYKKPNPIAAASPLPTGLMSPALSVQSQDMKMVYPGFGTQMESFLRLQRDYAALGPNEETDNEQEGSNSLAQPYHLPPLLPDQDQVATNDEPAAEAQPTLMPLIMPSTRIDDKLEDYSSRSAPSQSPTPHFEEVGSQAWRRHASAPPVLFARGDNHPPTTDRSRARSSPAASEEDLYGVSISPPAAPEDSVPDDTSLTLTPDAMEINENIGILVLVENDENSAALSNRSETQPNRYFSPAPMESIEHENEHSEISQPSARRLSPIPSNGLNNYTRLSTESPARYYTPLMEMGPVGEPSLDLQSSILDQYHPAGDIQPASPSPSPIPEQGGAQVQIQSNRHQFAGTGNVLRAGMQLWDALADYTQPKLLPGNVRVSWNCRCGKRLHINVPQSQEAPALAFAQMACGPPNIGSVSTSHGSPLHTAPSDISLQAAPLSHSTAASFTANATTTRNGDPIGSGPTPSAPQSAERHMLLCIKKGDGCIELKNVDLSDVTADTDAFQKIRAVYNQSCRGRFGLNRISKPRKMQYIKFKLLHNKNSTDCVEQLQSDSVPTREAIQNREYTLQTCLPGHGNFTLPPDIFMHVLLNPGEHLGSLAADMIPKKLGSQLAWDDDTHSIYYPPVGWGIYIE